MNRRYIAALALAAALVLGAGIFTRLRLLQSDRPAAAPPSEATALQQLSQESQLRRMSGFLADRIAGVAPMVEYLPGLGVAGIRWGSADTVVSTGPHFPIVVVHVPRLDTVRVLSPFPRDSVQSRWTLIVGRRPGGRVVSAAGLSGGRSVVRCGERDVEEYVLGFSLHEGFAGAGLFDLTGRAMGMVVRCGTRLAPVPSDEIARLLAERDSEFDRLRERYGLAVASLDQPAKTYFRRDSGALVTEVRRRTPADLAGLEAGDVIIAIGGRRVATAADVASSAVDAPFDTVTVWRRRRPAAVTIRIPLERDTVAGAENGIELAPDLPDRGVAVSAVRAGSVAAAAGLRPGDRIVRIGAIVATSAALAQRLLDRAAGQPTLLVFERDSVERAVLLPR